MKTRELLTSMGRAAIATVAGLLILSGSATATQAVTGTYLEIEIDSGEEPQIARLSLGPDRMRMDTAEVSIVSLGGDDAKMLMIQHSQKRYMELTAEMMAGMAAMMGPQAPPEVETEIEDQTMPTFVRTGNTKQVGEWNAYEVRVEHPDQQQEVTMWFSQDIDADFRDIAQQMMSSFSSLMNNPMLRMGGGGPGGGTMGIVNSVRAQLASLDIPDGFPVQIVSSVDGVENVNTLRAIDQDATFEPGTWEPDESYQKMQMPFRR